MNRVTRRSYVIGLLASVALTLAAYAVAATGSLSGMALIAAVLGLAMAQLVVQMIFFLHLGAEHGKPWKLASFLGTVVLVLIIVVASIWIMNHLNYGMMASPDTMQQYIQSQQAF